MKRRTVLALLLSMATASALGQRMSFAPEAFSSDVNSVAGVSKIGAILYAADPSKQSWQNYCGASQALASRGEFRQAIRTAAKALYVGDPNGQSSSPAYIFATNDIATAYGYAGDHASASEWASKMLAASDKGTDQDWLRQQLPTLRANARRIRALALSQQGRPAEASAELRSGLEGLPYFGAGYVKAEMRLALASIEMKSGNLDKAAEALAPVLRESDATLKLAANRAAGDLALARKDSKAAVGHFKLGLAGAQQGKDPYQVVMLQLGLARAHRLVGEADAADEPLQQALVGLEQLRSSFSSFEMRTALFGNLQDVFDEAVDYFSMRGESERAFAASEASRARAMLDLQTKIAPGTSGAGSAAVQPRLLAQIQSELTTGQALVVYHQLPQRLIAWVVTKEGLQSHTAAVAVEQVRKDVARLRSAIEQDDKAVVGIAQDLHKKLIEPLKLKAGQALIFVPHKALHLLPFQALRDGSQWLIERHAVSTALSASLVRVTAKGSGPALLAALGNPDLGSPEWALPGAEQEVKALQGIYEKGSVFVRKDATKGRLSEIAPGAEVIHIAAHAVVDDVDPMYSLIKLATIGLTGSDMEAREFASMNLSKARLVTLSACNSGVGKVAQGDEFMGFKRAVLAAGAVSALVSLWPVDDESTRVLMTEFHQRWATQSKALAMQAAQIKVLSDPKFSSPFYWAPFTLVGDPG